MRYAILADIHSNLAAFEAVLDDIKAKGGVDEIWCLGDIVGYGPDPRACIELLRQQQHISVAGNHDLAAIGGLDISDLGSYGATVCRWTGKQLSHDEVSYLKSLPQMLTHGDFTFVHGSPRDPVWGYVLSTSNAKSNLPWFETRFCLGGHTHVPLVFEYISKSDACLMCQLPRDAPLRLEQNRLIINPGSVGQPRDGDPRASYAIYDSSDATIWHYRVPYDIAATQEKMKGYKLPPDLATRLSWGR